MIQRLLDRIIILSLHNPSLDRSLVTRVLAQHGIEHWFLYAFDQWKNRWHIWRGILWAVKNLDRKGMVLETGCGCGWNLFWLAANGFSSLTGLDIDSSAVAAGNELAEKAALPVKLSCGDALDPRSLDGGPFHLVIALNWTYHVPDFELGAFLESYAQHLAPGGVLLLDVVDRSYGAVPNSQYLTSDWANPEGERRPSEYLHRYTSEEVNSIAASRGFQTAASFSRDETIPRSVHLLRRG